MTIYTAQIYYIQLAPPYDIVCTYKGSDGFTFTFQLPTHGYGCEYTTDEGLTWASCQSGVKITTQSNGNSFVSGNTYYFRFRTVEENCDERWLPSDVYEETSGGLTYKSLSVSQIHILSEVKEVDKEFSLILSNGLLLMKKDLKILEVIQESIISIQKKMSKNFQFLSEYIVQIQKEIFKTFLITMVNNLLFSYIKKLSKFLSVIGNNILSEMKSVSKNFSVNENNVLNFLYKKLFLKSLFIAMQNSLSLKKNIEKSLFLVMLNIAEISKSISKQFSVIENNVLTFSKQVVEIIYKFLTVISSNVLSFQKEVSKNFFIALDNILNIQKEISKKFILILTNELNILKMIRKNLNLISTMFLNFIARKVEEILKSLSVVTLNVVSLNKKVFVNLTVMMENITSIIYKFVQRTLARGRKRLIQISKFTQLTEGGSKIKKKANQSIIDNKKSAKLIEKRGEIDG